MTTAQNRSNELSEKRALVTGGTKGMGEAIVKRLRLAGATVMTTARSRPDELQSPELFIQSDISTPDGVDKVVKGVLARLGGVDILINNVGGSSAPSGGALALSDDDWQQTFNTNLFAAVRLDRAFLPKMLEQRSGVIIHISSIQRTLPFGTPDDVRNEVQERMETLAPRGGFIFCTAHNIQADTPTENMVALFEAYRTLGRY